MRVRGTLNHILDRLVLTVWGHEVEKTVSHTGSDAVSDRAVQAQEALEFRSLEAQTTTRASEEPNHRQLAAVLVEFTLRNVDSNDDPVGFHLIALDLLTTGHVQQLIADVDTNTTSRSTTREGALNLSTSLHGHPSLGCQLLEELIAANKRVHQGPAEIRERSVQEFCTDCHDSLLVG